MSFLKIDQIKVATFLRFKDEHNNVVFVGKNHHPLLKKRNQDSEYQLKNEVEKTFMLNFPAGLAELKDIQLEESSYFANLRVQAARELYEETGGLFLPEFEAEISSEIADKQLHFDSSSLVLLNQDPIIVSMHNSWSNKDITVAYYFFNLDVKIFANQLSDELEKEGDVFFVEIMQRRLNQFCSKALQSFGGQSVFGEVLEYFVIDWDDFLARLQMLQSKKINKDWFFKDTDEPELYFLTKQGKISFNKAYFYASMHLL